MRYRSPDAVYSYGAFNPIDAARDAARDIFTDALDAGKTAATERVKGAASEVLKSLTPAQRALLDQVEARARAGVVEEVKANAIPLAIMAFSMGALGGFVLRGKVGLAAAVGLAGWAAYTIGSKSEAKGK